MDRWRKNEQDARKDESPSGSLVMLTIEARRGEIVMVLVEEPKPSIREAVYKRFRAGICLRCEEPAAKGMRGLCSKHYARHYRSLGGLTKQQRIDKESKLVRDGQLMPNRQGQRPEEN